MKTKATPLAHLRSPACTSRSERSAKRVTVPTELPTRNLEVAKCTGFSMDTDSVDTVKVAELLTEDHLPPPSHCKPATLVHVAISLPEFRLPNKIPFLVQIET